MIKMADGTWSGKIHVQAKDVDMVEAMFRKLHGSAIELGGMSHLLEVSSDLAKRLPKKRAVSSVVARSWSSGGH